MYFLLWVVVKEIVKVTYLTKLSSNQVTRLHMQFFFFEQRHTVWYWVFLKGNTKGMEARVVCGT